MPLDHVKAMRKILGEAGGMLDAGDDRLRRSFLEEADEQIQIEIARAQAHFLGSIARSLLLLGTMIVDEAEDASGAKLPDVLAIRDATLRGPEGERDPV
jgi:hypothetical protein